MLDLAVKNSAAHLEHTAQPLRSDSGGNSASLDARDDNGIEALLRARAAKAPAGPEIRDERVE